LTVDLENDAIKHKLYDLFFQWAYKGDTGDDDDPHGQQKLTPEQRAQRDLE
jgi:hypothetical protein